MLFIVTINIPYFWIIFELVSLMICQKKTISVTVDNYTSLIGFLFCCFPQGSILGPRLFWLYLLSLGKTITIFNNIFYQCNVDDIQLHLSFKVYNFSDVSVLNKKTG